MHFISYRYTGDFGVSACGSWSAQYFGSADRLTTLVFGMMRVLVSDQLAPLVNSLLLLLLLRETRRRVIRASSSSTCRAFSRCSVFRCVFCSCRRLSESLQRSLRPVPGLSCCFLLGTSEKLLHNAARFDVPWKYCEVYHTTPDWQFIFN